MADFADEMMSFILSAIYEESRAIAYDIETDLIERLSVSVEHVTSNGHLIIVRSKPGEYPRMDSGELVRSIGSETTRDGDGPDTVEIMVYTADDSAKVNKLEGPLRRHLIGQTFFNWTPVVISRFSGMTL